MDVTVGMCPSKCDSHHPNPATQSYSYELSIDSSFSFNLPASCDPIVVMVTSRSIHPIVLLDELNGLSGRDLLIVCPLTASTPEERTIQVFGFGNVSITWFVPNITIDNPSTVTERSPIGETQLSYQIAFLVQYDSGCDVYGSALRNEGHLFVAGGGSVLIRSNGECTYNITTGYTSTIPFIPLYYEVTSGCATLGSYVNGIQYFTSIRDSTGCPVTFVGTAYSVVALPVVSAPIGVEEASAIIRLGYTAYTRSELFEVAPSLQLPSLEILNGGSDIPCSPCAERVGGSAHIGSVIRTLTPLESSLLNCDCDNSSASELDLGCVNASLDSELRGSIVTKYGSIDLWFNAYNYSNNYTKVTFRSDPRCKDDCEPWYYTFTGLYSPDECTCHRITRTVVSRVHTFPFAWGPLFDELLAIDTATKASIVSDLVVSIVNPLEAHMHVSDECVGVEMPTTGWYTWSRDVADSAVVGVWTVNVYSGVVSIYTYIDSPWIRLDESYGPILVEVCYLTCTNYTQLPSVFLMGARPMYCEPCPLPRPLFAECVNGSYVLPEQINITSSTIIEPINLPDRSIIVIGSLILDANITIQNISIGGSLTIRGGATIVTGCLYIQDNTTLVIDRGKEAVEVTVAEYSNGCVVGRFANTSLGDGDECTSARTVYGPSRVVVYFDYTVGCDNTPEDITFRTYLMIGCIVGAVVLIVAAIIVSFTVFRKQIFPHKDIPYD